MSDEANQAHTLLNNLGIPNVDASDKCKGRLLPLIERIELLRARANQGRYTESDINWYRDAYATIKKLHDELKECLKLAAGYLAQDNCDCSQAEFARIQRALHQGK